MSKAQKQARRELLLKEFNQIGDFYEEKQIGDKWYVKMYNGSQDRWQVAVYTLDSFRRYKTFQSK